MVVNMINNMPQAFMNFVSSIFPVGANASNYVGAASVATGFSKFINILAEIFYFVCKWMLYVVDVLFSYIQQLAGLDMKYDSLESLVSEDSDMVFNLLLSNKSNLVIIIKNLLALAVVLIILFSIIAVIKGQFEAVHSGKATSVSSVLKNTLKSFALLLVTPMIAIVGIIASNLILQSLYAATNTSGAFSLSTQIFYASSTTANCYRNYADNGKRIPIVFNTTVEDEIKKYYDSNGLTQEYIDYIKNANNYIYYSSHLMFETGNFVTYDSLDTLSGMNPDASQAQTAYYVAYDIDGTSSSKYKRIENYAVEYYVMADVIEFCINSSRPAYFKTIEEVLESIADYAKYNPDAGTELFYQVTQMFNIQFLDDNEIAIPAVGKYKSMLDVFNSRDWNIIRFSSIYLAPDNAGDPVVRMQIQYNHLKGQTDELSGAKYIMAVEKSMGNFQYFYPLTNGEAGTSSMNFDSSNLYSGMISAKGVFDESVYPTAIRQDAYSNIEFYREKIQASLIGDTSGLLSFDFKQEDSDEGASSIVSIIKSIIDPSSMVPNFQFDSSAVQLDYAKEVKTVTTLTGGRLHIGYLFSDVLTSAVNKSLYTMELGHLYNPYSLNFLILVVGTILILKTCLFSIFSLVQRAYDLFLVILVYPTACATIPLDNGGYNSWVKTYFSKLFSTYGLILGLNFVLMLFPVIQNISFFSPQDIATNKSIRRLGSILFGFLTVNQVTNMLNLVVCILFELVAFTLIKTIPETISKIVGANDVNQTNVLQDIVKTAKTTMKVMRTIIPTNLVRLPLKFATNKKFRNEAIAKVTGKVGSLKDLIPGSALYTAVLDKKNLNNKKREQKEKYNDLKESLDSGSASKEEVEEKLKAFQSAQQSYTNAMNDPTADRKAEHQKKKKEEETGLSSREDDDLDENQIDESAKTTRQIKKDQKKSKKILKKLKKKEKKEGLTEEEKKSQQTYTKLKEAADEERENRKGEKKGVKSAKKDVKKLNRKLNRGDYLTDEEEQKLHASEKVLENQGAQKVERKEKIKEQKLRLKEQRKDKKQKLEEEQDKQDDYKLFRHTGNKKAQRLRLEEIDRDRSRLSKRLQKMGFSQDISHMSGEEIEKLLDNPEANGLNSEQVKLINEYQKIDKHKNELININALEYENKAKRKQEVKNAKNDKIAGYRGINFIKHIQKHNLNKKAVKAEKQQEQLAILDEKIDQMQQSGTNTYTGFNPAKNIASMIQYKKYKSLQRKRSKLSTNINTSQNWISHNNSEYRKEYKAGAKDRSNENKWRKQAIKYLEDNGIEVNSANIERAMQSKRAFENKKNQDNQDKK